MSDVIDEAEQAVRAIYHGQGWRIGVRALCSTAVVACVPADALGRRPRHGPLAHGAYEDTAECLGRQSRARCTANGEASDWTRKTRRCCLLLGRRGQPAGWSPFANDAGNYNVAVTGKSGSGKSVLMQELVSGLVSVGGEAVVIDDGRSFQHTAEALGGAFIAFGKDSACLNPFAMIDAAAVASRWRLPGRVFLDAGGRGPADVPPARRDGRHRGGAH